MPERDGEGRVRVLTKAEGVGRKGGVEGRGRGGGGKRWIQLREKRRVVQYPLRAIGGGRIELRDGGHLHRRVRGGGGVAQVLVMGGWGHGGSRGDGQARRGLEGGVRVRGGGGMSEGGGREGSSQGRTLSLVAQIREVKGVVGRGGRHVGKGQILHVWGDGGEGERCGGGAVRARQGGGLRVAVVVEVLSGRWIGIQDAWVDPCRRALVDGGVGERLRLQTGRTCGRWGGKGGVLRLRDGVIGVVAGGGGGGQEGLRRGGVRGRRRGEGEGGLVQRGSGGGGGGENGGIVDGLRNGRIRGVTDGEGGEGGLRKRS